MSHSAPNHPTKPYLSNLPIVWLSPSKSTRMTPVPICPIIAWPNPCPASTPKPPIDQVRLQIWPVAAVEVALPPTGPNIAYPSAGDPLFHKVILRRGLDAHGVHTVTTANVSCVEPVHLEVPGGAVLPRKEVVVNHAARVPPAGMLHTCGEEQQKSVFKIHISLAASQLFAIL